MARLYSVFLLFGVILSDTIMAQSDFDIIKKLESAGLLNSFERKEVLKELKEKENRIKKKKDEFHIKEEEELRKEVHYPLMLLLQAKKYSTPGVFSALVFRPSQVQLSPNKESLVKKQLTSFLNKLISAKLISVITKAEAQKEVDELTVRSEYELTAFVAEKTEKEFFLTKTKYKKFADGLLFRKLITENDYREILDKTEKRFFRDYQEPLMYLQNTVFIDLGKYPDKPEIYLEALYRETAKVYPGLDFDKINFKQEQDKRESFNDFTVNNLVAEIWKGNEFYRYASFINAESKGRIISPAKYYIPENYHQIFNKILADNGSDYRLHRIMTGNNEEIGIVALTKKKFDGLMWSYSGMRLGGYIQLSYESFNSRITTRKINEAIDLYDSIGLFSEFSEEEKKLKYIEVTKSEINYFSDILSSYQKIVFEIDLEYGIDDGQYKKITKQISSVSRGNFIPDSIIDTYNFDKSKEFDFGFTLNGKKYLRKLKQEDDWLDVAFWDLVERSVSEQDTKGKFYNIYPNDGMRIVYLSNEQYRILKEREMLEFDDEALTE